MARQQPGLADGPQRYKSTLRKISTSKVRYPWRTRMKRKYLKPSADERAKKKAQRHAKRQDYYQALMEAREVIHREATRLHERFGGHDVQWYFEDIVQHNRMLKSKRKVTAWNAYLSSEVKRLNDESPGERRKVSELAPDISRRWKSMSLAEKEAATNTLKQDLEDQQEMKALSARNVPLESFRDAQATLQSIEKEIINLYARTGTEAVLFAVRASTESYLRPFIAHTTARIPEFFNTTMKQTMTEISLRLEAYCVSGVEGVVQNYVQELLELKKMTSALIIEKLRETAKAKIARMSYTNFEDKITDKFGVVIENWPLKAFCSPSDVKSRNEVKVLYSAWQSGATRFRRMSNDEWKTWQDCRFERSMDQMDGATANEGDNNGGNVEEDPRTQTACNAEGDQHMHDENTVPPHSVCPAAPNAIPTIPKSSKHPEVPTREPIVHGNARPGPLVDFINSSTVTSATGETLIIGRKPRKQRSDKGVKRAPKGAAKSKGG